MQTKCLPPPGWAEGGERVSDGEKNEVIDLGRWPHRREGKTKTNRKQLGGVTSESSLLGTALGMETGLLLGFSQAQHHGGGWSWWETAGGLQDNQPHS